MNKIYFNGLDGLRALAAIIVILDHVESVKREFLIPTIDISSLGILKELFNIGSVSVTFFFVLSGFLITYLLLFEEKNTNKVNVKKFYIRRALKIWPLYFLITLIGFTFLYFTKGFSEYGLAILFHILILPNFILFIPEFSNKVNPLCMQSWSIGVEEQFYLLWPLVVRRKTVLWISLFIISLFFTLRFTSFILFKSNMSVPEWLSYTNEITLTNRIDSMAIGAIIAYFLFVKGIIKIPAIIKTLYTIGLIVMLFNGVRIYSLGQHFVYSVLFGVLIYFIASNQNKTFLDHPILKYLGSISYGIYMWHIIAINIVLGSLMVFFPNFDYSQTSNNIIIYVLSTMVTILISALSFSIFEVYFLNIKKKLSPNIRSNAVSKQ